MRSYCGILAGVLLAGTVGTTPAAAEGISRLGPSIAAISAVVKGSAVAYDSKNSIYLVVSAYGDLNGRFVSAAGDPIGAPFTIQAGSAGFTHFPGVAYSPHANGGSGGFLVAWHQSQASGATVHARMVASTGGLGSVSQLTTDGSWWESAVDIAYSTTSQEFFVVWQAAGIRGQRVGLSGEKLGANIFVTGTDYHRDPSIAYNPTTNEFMVVYSGVDAVSAYAGARRVTAGSGGLPAGETILNRAGGTYITDVAYNPSTNQFLAAWYQGGTFGRLLDAAGNAVSNVITLSTRFTAYDGLGMDYNTSSGTFLLVSHDQSSYQNGAVELSGSSGVPGVGIVATDTATTVGNFYPKVAARSGQAEWLMSTATSFAATTVQRLQSGGTGGGGGGGGGVLPIPTRKSVNAIDFDGDKKDDIAIYRPSDAQFWIRHSGNGQVDVRAVGNGAQVAVPGDYDGDGKPDLAVWKPSTGMWTIATSSSGYGSVLSIGWGDSNFLAVPGDYDGDGKTDIAVWRPSTGIWWILKSSSSFTSYMTIGWGDPSFIPVQGDYDGDGKTDVAAWNRTTGLWWILTSSSNFKSYYSVGWGDITFQAVPGDYDGDGKTDIAVWRPSTGMWWVRTSSSNYQSYFTRGWGDPDFMAAPADYDGDGKTDIAVWKPGTSTWWVLTSSSSFTTYTTTAWGTVGDVSLITVR